MQHVHEKISKKLTLPFEQGSDPIWCRRLATLQGKQFHTSSPPAHKKNAKNVSVSVMQNHWQLSDYPNDTRAVCWMNLGASEQNAKYGKNKRVYKHSVYIIHYNTLLSVNLHNSTCQKATIHALSPRTMKDEKSVILQPIKQCDVWTKIGLYIALLTI